MKKYVIFSISFILVFPLLQAVFEMILTLTYTPDITGAWNSGALLSQETIIVGSNHSILPVIFIAILSASISYFITKKFTRTTTNVK